MNGPIINFEVRLSNLPTKNHTLIHFEFEFLTVFMKEDWMSRRLSYTVRLRRNLSCGGIATYCLPITQHTIAIDKNKHLSFILARSLDRIYSRAQSMPSPVCPLGQSPQLKLRTESTCSKSIVSTSTSVSVHSAPGKHGLSLHVRLSVGE